MLNASFNKHGVRPDSFCSLLLFSLNIEDPEPCLRLWIWPILRSRTTNLTPENTLFNSFTTKNAKIDLDLYYKFH
jgi:hypothetical protein